MSKTPMQLHDRSARRSVVEEIWEQLQGLILRGDIAPGTRLIEMEIAAQTGASQASVREALQSLERDGLVVRKGRTGTFVTEVEPEKMQDLLLVRLAVESAAVRRVVGSLGAEQIAELEALVEEMREAGRAGDVAAVVEHDMEFHRRICEWAEHPILLRVCMLLHAQLARFLVTHDRTHFPDLSLIADKHVPLVRALAGADPELAVEEMTRHIQDALRGAARITGDHSLTPQLVP